MNNGVQQISHRLLRRIGLLLIMLALLGPLASIQPAAAQGDDDALDLAAMVLTPWDLADAGLESYGHTVSQSLYIDELAAQIAAESNVPADDVRDVLEDAGFVRAYFAWYSPPADEGEDLSSRTVVSYLFEFEDDDGASDAWDFIADEADDSEGEDIDGFDDLGDASEATLINGESGSEPYIQLDVNVLLDNLHVGMAVIDWSGEEPEEDLAAELAGYALERVEDGADADQPALSDMVVRLAGDEVEYFYDMYMLRDGEAIWTFRETPDDADEDLEEAAEIGLTADYRIWQRIAAGSDEMAGSVFYYLTVLRFEDEDAAAEWFSGQDETVAEDEDYTDFEIDEADYGDGAFTYSAVSTDGEAHYRGITFQLGDLVTMIDIGGPIMPTEDAVAAIADAQLACFEDAGCHNPLELPADLEDFVDEVAATNADGSDEGDEEEDSGRGVGGTVVSGGQVHGFAGDDNAGGFLNDAGAVLMVATRDTDVG